MASETATATRTGTPSRSRNQAFATKTRGYAAPGLAGSPTYGFGLGAGPQ
jgi:hypothetical protein